jgi:signal transduction histidine kinase
MVETGAGTIRKWPRAHLVYFLLAAFDLLAVGGGLYLSHRLSNVFEDNVRINGEWGNRFVDIWNLGDLAASASEPANDVFLSRDADGESERLAKATDRLEGTITRVRQEITQNVPIEIASHPLRTLSYVEQSLTIMISHGRRGLSLYKEGQLAEAAASMSLMNRAHVILKRRLNEAALAIRNIQNAYAARHFALVEWLKRFEYLIGAGLVFMVLCVALYGHWIGRLMRSKYEELAASHGKSQAFAIQLQAMNEEVTKLNVDLADRMRQLREARDDIVRRGRLAQLGQLTATVAHEIRNPLGSVRTSAYLLARKIKGKGLAVEPQLERINNGVARCDAIITDLLEFSRTETLQCETRDLDSWLAGTVEEESARLPSSIEVECHLGLDGEEVAFDPSRLARVIVNLLNNASGALLGRGDTLARHAGLVPRIVIATRASTRGIEIAVTDNGPGMDAETLQKVFEPLFTTKNFGTGLGLPAAQKIAEQHGGGVEVTSKPGEGTSVIVWLPGSHAATLAA